MKMNLKTGLLALAFGTFAGGIALYTTHVNQLLNELNTLEDEIKTIQTETTAMNEIIEVLEEVNDIDLEIERLSSGYNASSYGTSNENNYDALKTENDYFVPSGYVHFKTHEFNEDYKKIGDQHSNLGSCMDTARLHAIQLGTSGDFTCSEIVNYVDCVGQRVKESTILSGSVSAEGIIDPDSLTGEGVLSDKDFSDYIAEPYLSFDDLTEEELENFSPSSELIGWSYRPNSTTYNPNSRDGVSNEIINSTISPFFNQRIEHHKGINYHIEEINNNENTNILFAIKYANIQRPIMQGIMAPDGSTHDVQLTNDAMKRFLENRKGKLIKLIEAPAKEVKHSRGLTLSF